VTGSGTGIGREVALEFARQGADVVLHYAHAVAGAESAVPESKAMGRKAAVFKAGLRPRRRSSSALDSIVAVAGAHSSSSLRYRSDGSVPLVYR